MTVSEQLIAHIRETATPDKARILHMRELARTLAGGSLDPVAAAALVRRLNGAFLVLQLATLSEDDDATGRYRRECLSLVRAIERGLTRPATERTPANGGLARKGWGPAEGPCPSPRKTLDVLFNDALGGMYGAERKLSKALPRLARGARSAALRQALETHQADTDRQIERLRRVFAIVGRRAQGRSCPAMDGILEKGEALLVGFVDSPALDAGLLAAWRAVEHYEISRYGTLSRWAVALGLHDAAELLGRSLEEESRTDALLARLAGTLDAPASALG